MGNVGEALSSSYEAPSSSLSPSKPNLIRPYGLEKKITEDKMINRENKLNANINISKNVLGHVRTFRISNLGPALSGLLLNCHTEQHFKLSGRL